jgi:phosphoribosylanthranilate isomerase
MTKVKICGVRTYETALMIAQAGVDMIGLNFYPKTPRYIDPSSARVVVDQLRDAMGDDCPLLVGLFVNATAHNIQQTVASVGLDFVQLSGDETPQHLQDLGGIAFKSIRPADMTSATKDVADFMPMSPTDERVPNLILDAYNPKLYGGTGETASVDVALAAKAHVPRLMLAGGLNPDNVAERIRAVQPWGVDVASGVEDGVPGIKDPDKVRALMQAIKEAQG